MRARIHLHNVAILEIHNGIAAERVEVAYAVIHRNRSGECNSFLDLCLAVNGVDTLLQCCITSFAQRENGSTGNGGRDNNLQRLWFIIP